MTPCDVLSTQRADLNRLSGEIGAGGVRAPPDQGVIAGGDEERELVIGVRPGDLDRAGARARFSQQQCLGKVRPIKKIRSRLFAQHDASTAAV